MSLKARLPSLPTLVSRTTALVNRTTASITDDFEPKQEVEDPKRLRAFIRFLLTLILGGVLLAIIAFIATTIPEVKVYREKYNQNEFKDQADGGKKIFQCPCSNQTGGGISWNSFIQFFMIIKNKRESNITFNYFKGFCDSQTEKFSVPQRQCKDAIAAMFQEKDDRNHLPTINLLSPFMLNRDVPLLISSKLQLSPLFSMTPMENKDYGIAKEIALSFTIMLNSYKWKQSSSVHDFWKASQDYSAIHGPSKFAFGMEINWEKYAKECSPKYCDVTQSISMMHRVLRAMAEIGGFSSIALFILRTFLWPPLTKIISFLN